MKIAIILGTRPEIIKMAPIIKAMDKQGIDYFILHTGQHYSYEMDRKFFEDLELREAKHNLQVGGQEYRKQVGMMIREIMSILEKERPDVAIVQGDTNSVLAGAQAANKLRIKIAHHEAGLRSHNLNMLEEMNRIVTDHISDFLFAPTEDAYNHLIEEGIDQDKIILSGNTIVDAVLQNLELAERKVAVLRDLGLERGGYILATAHRAENVDIKERLQGILSGMGLVAKELSSPVIYPMHPRTLKKIEQFQLTVPDAIKIVEPLGFLEFIQLEANAKLVITDSGGLQEEACILKVPCVTVRDETERPETIKAGFNILAGADPEKILQCAKEMINFNRQWINPFGDGLAGKRIIDHIISSLSPKNYQGIYYPEEFFKNSWQRTKIVDYQRFE